MACLVAALLGSTGPAPAATAAESFTAAGTTRVHGSAAAATVVTIPNATSISAAVSDNPDIVVEGSGRYIGVGLVALDSSDDLRPALVAGRIDEHAVCDETGCPYGVATPVAAVDLQIQDGRVRIPAGVYRLHLITELSPADVTITLRLAGLEGTTDIQPTAESGVATVPLTPGPELPASQWAYWGSGRHDLGDSYGLMWTMAWVRHPLYPANHYEYCAFRAADPGDHPGCIDPWASIGINHTLVGPPIKAWVAVEGITYPVAGDTGQKVWFAGGLSDTIDGLAVWLPFEGEPLQVASPSVVMKAHVFPAIVEPGAAERVAGTSSPVPLPRTVYGSRGSTAGISGQTLP